MSSSSSSSSSPTLFDSADDPVRLYCYADETSTLLFEEANDERIYRDPLLSDAACDGATMSQAIDDADAAMSDVAAPKQLPVPLKRLVIKKHNIIRPRTQKVVLASPAKKQHQRHLTARQIAIQEGLISAIDETRCTERHLTAEERRVYIRERLPLPRTAPLSDAETDLLRYVRRRIVSKRGSRHFREQQKQTLYSLKDDMTRAENENVELRTEVEELRRANSSLRSEMSRLRGSLSHSSQGAACVFVLCVVFSLVFPYFYKVETETSLSAVEEGSCSSSSALEYITSSRKSSRVLLGNVSDTEEVEVLNDDTLVVWTLC